MMNDWTNLDYSKKKLKEIPQEAFNPKVKWLILSDNKIKSIPDGIKGLKNLTRLAINDNIIEEVSGFIGDLVNLTWIDFTRNKLKNLPTEMGRLYKISGLGLSENEFDELPECIYKMVNLRKFGFFSNKIKKLSPDIRNLTSLVKIDLSNNQLSYLPEEFCELVNLNWLNLSSNRLKKLPSRLNNLTQLEELGLGSNQLTELPNMKNLNRLRILPVFKNKIKRINGSFSFLENIEKLDFSDNKIEIFPSHIIDIPTLRYLNLKSNKISILDAEKFDGRVSSITMIDLSENLLPCIPLRFFKTFSKITTIRLNDNPFTFKSSQIPPCPTLYEMCMSRALNLTKPFKMERKTWTVNTCDYCSRLYTVKPHVLYSMSSIGDGSTFVVEKMVCSRRCYKAELR